MKLRLFIIIILFFIALSGFFFLKGSQQVGQKTLRVMVYSSFVNVFGPGPLIQKQFEKICDCKIKWLKVSDSTLLAQRLSLKKDGFKTDVVLGIDQLSLKSMHPLPWKKIATLKEIVFVPPTDQFLSPYFVPYNWSPMGFLSRSKKDPALSLKDLLGKKFHHNISLPSPRTSTVGLQFYYWIWSVFQEQTEEFLRDLKSQLYGLSPSWSTSYALFQRGHVDLSFSYLSSLLYHRQKKQEDFYFMFFKEGHPYQVEMAGVSGFCQNCELAQKFVHFLLTPSIQQLLKTKNYMLPVTMETHPDGRTHLDSSSLKDFPILKQIKLISYDHWPAFLRQKQSLLKKWDTWL